MRKKRLEWMLSFHFEGWLVLCVFVLVHVGEFMNTVWIVIGIVVWKFATSGLLVVESRDRDRYYQESG